jgi:hypothetical protein
MSHYHHTTPEMAAPMVTAIQARLTVLIHAAEDTLERSRPAFHAECFDDYGLRFWQIPGKWRFGAFGACKRPGAEPRPEPLVWCGAPRRNPTGDPILTIDAPVVHDAVLHPMSPTPPRW